MRHLAQRNEYDRGTSRSRCDRATDRRDGTRCASFFGVRRGPLQRAAMRDASFARKPMAEGARVGPASRGQRRKKPPRATASVVLLVSGRWERADAGAWPEIARGDSARRVLPIVIRGARTTPGPITLLGINAATADPRRFRHSSIAFDRVEQIVATVLTGASIDRPAIAGKNSTQSRRATETNGSQFDGWPGDSRAHGRIERSARMSL